ncbi:uncharacterized protein LOC584101 [Strongylocentrotus purpuratus]|uniref:Malate dehydrogenase n=1 Tax=Strongylocentrotus purpuratus TaxID=7668 RepID=A0A7M7SVZ5_STRPU|nr:uncharacterized protein LOC584101 [Strongylocentrotus purpuratus]|eukprot:XP_011679998.1 PREDICTED: uncharacterized protein LOC584101 [Strongylocentrotus purpuratus]
MDSTEGVLVKVAEAHSFIERCMVARGTNPTHASLLAELLVSADSRGHFSHGLNRIDVYLENVEHGVTAGDGEPVIIKEMAGTAWVDGRNLLGPVVGQFCTDLVIEKAKQAGIGWVVAKGSNHYGIAGWYSMRIKDTGMIGLSFTNTSPCVYPTRSKQIITGTNPIACSAPANNGDSFDLDMATTTVAYGKVEICHLKGQTLPSGWGSNSDGKETSDPKEVLNGGGLQPLGGGETTGGYKGTGLALMVEVITGILGGAHFGTNIRKWSAGEREADLGQCFVALNPEAFAPGFSERMTSLIAMCRNAEPANGETEVLVAGDRARHHMEKVAREGGIKYHRNLITKLDVLAARLEVDPIRRETTR